MRKNKKSLLLGAVIAFSSIMVLSATYAWFFTTDTQANHFNMSYGSARIVEEFTPPAAWKPGETVKKEAAVKNDGDSPVLARLTFEESLKLVNQPAKAYRKANVRNGVPQLCDTSPYLNDPGMAWMLPHELSMSTEGLPNDVSLLVKRKTSRPGTPGERTIYSFVAYRTITEDGPWKDKAQKVTADYEVEGTIIRASNLKYWFYAGQSETASHWTTDMPQTIHMGWAVTTGQNGVRILYERNNLSTTPQNNKWYYNPQDGYFYYVGLLQPNGKTGNLLSGLKLHGAAGDEYTGMDFVLTLRLEAIDNQEDTLTSSSGWNLDANSALAKALAKHCK